jgi:hypothetical protein
MSNSNSNSNNKSIFDYITNNLTLLIIIVLLCYICCSTNIALLYCAGNYRRLESNQEKKQILINGIQMTINNNNNTNNNENNDNREYEYEQNNDANNNNNNADIGDGIVVYDNNTSADIQMLYISDEHTPLQSDYNSGDDNIVVYEEESTLDPTGQQMVSNLNFEFTHFVVFLFEVIHVLLIHVKIEGLVLVLGMHIFVLV